MSTFKRMKDMSRASVNSWLDKWEDPETLVHQYLRDMQTDIAKAEVVTARHMASERMLKERFAEASARIAAAERRAADALSAGEEAKARLYLEEKLILEAQVKELADQHTNAKVQAEALALQLHALKEEFEGMRSKKDELIRKARLAKAKKQTAVVQQSVSIDTSSAATGFRRVEEKIMQLEAEAELRQLTSR